jgi:hypothetical protein
MPFHIRARFVKEQEGRQPDRGGGLELCPFSILGREEAESMKSVIGS